MDRQEFQRSRATKAFSSDRGGARRTHALLRSALSNHYVGPDGQLVEQFISSTLSTSRNAVRLALQMLVRDGIVKRQPNSGTRIVREMIRGSVDGYLFFGMPTEEAQRRVTIEEIERREVPMSPLVGRVLQLPGDKMLITEHLVRLDGEPICIDSGYHETGVPASRWEIGRDQNLVFEEAYGLGVGERERSYQSILSDAGTAKLLNIDEGAPLLLQEVLLSDSNGRPRELRFTHYRADRVAIVFKSKRDATAVALTA